MAGLRFRNLTPRVRFIVVSGLTLVPLAGVMLAAFLLIYAPVFGAMETVVTAAVKQMRPVHELQLALHKAAMPPNDFLIRRADAEKRAFRRLSADVEAAFSRARDAFPEESWAAERVAAVHGNWEKAHAAGERLLTDELKGEAAARAMESFDASITRAASRLNSLHERINGRIDSQYARARALETFGLWIIIAAFVLAMGLGFGGAMLLTRERRSLQERSLKDPLTGLYNRRGLETYLKDLTSAALKYEEPTFTVMLVDLDWFKGINDTHGHAVGDAVLRNLPRIIQGQLRDDDILARVGGDEFVVVLAHVPQARVPALADRIRQGVVTTPVATTEKGENLHISVTIGHATYPENGGDVETVMEAADQALYRAKDLGRNTCCGYDDASETVREVG